MRENLVWWILVISLIKQTIMLFGSAGGYKLTVTWDAPPLTRVIGLTVGLVSILLLLFALGWM